MAADCIFCRIVAGEIPSEMVYDDDLVVVIRDINPRAPTHLLVLPRAHIPSATSISRQDGELMGRIFGVASELARDLGLDDNGYRIVTNVGAWGGQTVDHLHFHLMGGRSFTWPPG
jgi:histidine triad (HIT) family protein